MDNLVQVSNKVNTTNNLIEQGIQLKLQQNDGKQVVWDIKTLCEKTCMSRSFVQNTLFCLSDFPKFKVGGKWLIPAEEAEHFLIEWSKHQPRV